jgi:hypothetical protein
MRPREINGEPLCWRDVRLVKSIREIRSRFRLLPQLAQLGCKHGVLHRALLGPLLVQKLLQGPILLPFVRTPHPVLNI